MTPDDERHLRRAIELSAHARAAGDQPFGSLLVGPDGRVLAEDLNTEATDADLSAHPELKLAVWAGRHLDPGTAGGTTMYTSTHPCPMCAAAVERSGLGRVVFALSMEQAQDLRGGTPARVQGPVRYEGPALYDEAKVPLTRE